LSIRELLHFTVAIPSHSTPKTKHKNRHTITAGGEREVTAGGLVATALDWSRGQQKKPRKETRTSGGANQAVLTRLQNASKTHLFV